MDIPESTPLKAKIALPVKDDTAILRFTEVTSKIASEHLSPSSNTTKLTPSANDSLNVIAFFDFGNVTRATFENSTEIKIDFEVQVMNHAKIVNGGTQWVSVGVEYKDESVWVSQMAVKTINPASSRPDLKVELWPNLGGYNVISKYVLFSVVMMTIMMMMDDGDVQIYVYGRMEPLFTTTSRKGPLFPKIPNFSDLFPFKSVLLEPLVQATATSFRADCR